jgi:hypothetical protein
MIEADLDSVTVAAVAMRRCGRPIARTPVVKPSAPRSRTAAAPRRPRAGDPHRPGIAGPAVTLFRLDALVLR